MDLISNSLWQVALALIATVTLVIFLGWFARMVKLGKKPQGQLIQVLDSSYIGPKERLLLVQVDQKQILIGVGANGMVRLSESARISTFAELLNENQDRSAVDRSTAPGRGPEQVSIELPVSQGIPASAAS